MALKPILLILLCALPVVADDADNLKFFESKVRPLLAERCYECHGPKKQKNGLRWDHINFPLRGGKRGPAIDRDKPMESLLLQAISYNDPELQMPPKKTGGKLSDGQIAILQQWVAMGAPWPTEAVPPNTTFIPGKIQEADLAWWSFQPITRAKAPAGADNWARNDIDRFVHAKLTATKLVPAAEAGREELVRRVYLDLHGLAPTAAQVAEFLADKRPDAYEKLVDQLLDSPRYGERWAQHWLDVVRFAESDGYRADGFRPQAYRYRDYVIKSFNSDKPYDQFVREQLAGDEIDPGNKDALNATMFLRHWLYEWNQRDVETQWNIVLNDLTETTADAFMAVGVACARCHDHKFDPIMHDDYYRMQAFFQSVLPTESKPVADLDTLRKFWEQDNKWKAETKDVRLKLHAIENPILIAHGGEEYPKFVDEIKAMVETPEELRKPHEQQIAQMAARQLKIDPANIEKFMPAEKKAEWEALKAELAKFDADKPKPLPTVDFVVQDVGPTAPATFIPDAKSKGEIKPGFLTILDPKEAVIPALDPALESTGRRTALANWLTQPTNPLTARVMVNRLWHYHFGRGIVATPNDFGRLGQLPTHPELLDYLASELLANGWHLKPIHRLICTSATYRQTARRSPPETALLEDPENRLLWRFPPLRLDAEQLRDSLLAVSGELDLNKTSGASVKGDSTGRSVFVKHIRNTPDGFLNRFNAPTGFGSTPNRSITNTPLQALLFFNADWPFQRAQAMAKQIYPKGKTQSMRIELAFRQAFGRDPDPEELASATAFLKKQQSILGPTVKAAVGLAKTHQPMVPAKAFFPELPCVGPSAVQFTPNTPTEKAVVSQMEESEGSSFTIEAVIRLRSLYENASVRTIASRWDGETGVRGWNFGVTSTKSAYQPRNLIMQLVGGDFDNRVTYEVVASDLRIPLDVPYYVAAVIEAPGTDSKTAGGTVTFYVKDLSNPKSDLQTVTVKHELKGPFQETERRVGIGGRDGKSKPGNWDGYLARVALSGTPLHQAQLLVNDKPMPATRLGDWTFAEGAVSDSLLWGDDAAPGKASPAAGAVTGTDLEAFTDFCHVLLNSNEFLYLN